jgi:predicted ATPase
LAIPATLQEALLARLDRLSEARQVAQLGATLGREFSYELLQAVSPLNDTDLHAALSKLVEAEILYQRGVGEQARYFFKHALIQDTAYQSLLKSTRAQYHQQIARVLAERFPDIKANQPELLAHHYTEAQQLEQAIPYWQQAGEQAMQRSAYIEAENYFTKGISLVQTLPNSIERTRQELRLQNGFGINAMVTKGLAAPEVGMALTRAYELCQQLGDSGQLFSVLTGLRSHWTTRGDARKALVYAEQLMQLAQQEQDPRFFLPAHMSLAVSYFMLGELALAHEHIEQALRLYEVSQRRSYVVLYGYDIKMIGLTMTSWLLWLLGYPGQALRKSQEALTYSREFFHPASLVGVLLFTSWFRIFRQEISEIPALLTEAINLCAEYEIALFAEFSTIGQGYVQILDGNPEEGIRQIQDALSLLRAREAEGFQSQVLAYQTEGYKKLGQADTGLSVVAQALDFVEESGERYYEAELYRLKGELTLQQENQKSKGKEQKAKVENDAQAEAESCFRKAIDVAQQQQAKSWELRAATSLARLWRSQGKKAEAHQLLSEVYNWFTEGFETKDLQEAQGLIEELRD